MYARFPYLTNIYPMMEEVFFLSKDGSSVLNNLSLIDKNQ